MRTEADEVSERVNEVAGMWWLPSKPKRKLAGVLKLDDNNAELRVEGNLLMVAEDQESTAPIILGMANDRITPYTLETCRVTSAIESALGRRYYSSHIYPENVYSLAHFKSSSQLHFSEYHMQIESLLQWTWKRGIDSDRTPLGIVIRYEKPEPIIMLESDEVKVTISFADDPIKTYGRHSVALEEHCTLDVFFGSVRHIENTADLLNYIVRFFTFGCDREIYSQVLYSKKEILHKEEPYLGIVRVRSGRMNYGLSKSFRESESLFSLQHPKYEQQVKNCFRAWIQKRTLLQPVLDLYLSTIYKSGMYLENLVLNVAYALEAYHRTFLEKNIMTKDDFKPVHEKLIERLADITDSVGIQRSLKERTRYAYEKSLRDKLIDLLAFLPDRYVSRYIGEPIAEFAKRCKDLRNELTHPDPSRPRKGNEFAENAAFVYHRMRMLLQYLLLCELEMDEDAIDYFLDNYINRTCSFIVVRPGI